jgi:protein Tex
MNESRISLLSSELKLRSDQVLATATLLAEGATVPFIARYRKEVTGNLDEVAVMAIRDRMAQLVELDARRETILKSLDERGLLSDDLKGQVEQADTLARLEDLYAPYRPKRRTRAMIAREQGLEPLAELLWSQDPAIDPATAATAYINGEQGVETAEAALAGARDILAERISDDAEARARVREIFKRTAMLRSRVLTGKETEGAKFKDYFEWSEPLAKAPSHRILAVRRGETEGVLIFRIQVEETEALAALEPTFVRPGSGTTGEQVRLAVGDAWKRLMAPALETEMRLESKKRADAEAIRVFAENLRELLLAAPLGEKSVLAIDPGFRTGCKVVCLDRQGKLLANEVIYPDRHAERAAEILRRLCAERGVEAIAIGNGTAGRETEAFVRAIGLPPHVQVVMVSESGASIYSASEVAREEFPEYDLTVRGAVSIGRRLMDPLAELVKLDPKSIGVGQYQHDVDQFALKQGLDDVVESCVNAVGVEVNTASKQLLSYVSGIGPALAESIVAHRNANGPFRSRADLKQVSRLGPKAFEQAAGFLRVRGGINPLDASAVHPESYGVVETMAKDVGASVADLLRDSNLRSRLDVKRYVSDKVGLPTLQDILAELAKPGRDPRQGFEAFSFAEGVSKPTDLKPGMKLPGLVTNVTAFGAFVDVGVHQDGLVHVSQLADSFVKNAADVVRVGQRVQVTVVEVDLERNRIALSMRKNPERPAPQGGTGGPSASPRQEGRSSPRPQGPRGGRPNVPQNDWFTEAMNKQRR